eukprot:2980778-Amphidinium_carterae.1
MLKKIFVQVITDNFVLPNRALMRTRPDVPLETLLEVKSPLPLGVLEVEVIEAVDLLASDVNLTGKRTSDPYLEIRVGNGVSRTSTVLGTTSPKWTDGPDYLWVYDMTQMVRIDLFDDDVWKEDFLHGTGCHARSDGFILIAVPQPDDMWPDSQDDSIGFVPGFNVHQLCKKCASQPHGAWFDVTHPEDGKQETAGRVKLRGRFLSVSELRTNLAVDNPAKPLVVTVKLLGLEGSKASILSGAKAM